MQNNYREQGDRRGLPPPTSPTEAFRRALTQVKAGAIDEVDLVTFIRDPLRSGSELQSALVKQIATHNGVIFSDDQIKTELRVFFAALLGGEDGIEKLDRLSSGIDEKTHHKTITGERATRVDRSHVYVDKLIWEVPVSAGTVIGLSMYADDSGPWAWSYYIGVPYKERSGLHGMWRDVQRSFRKVFNANLPV